MSYSYSQLDRENSNWFACDYGHNILKKISVTNGKIRGICPTSITFEYPITVIVGENGAGKSTLLSLIACAFHNNSDFCPLNRLYLTSRQKRNYYTYSDFFTFMPQEEGIKDIEIISEYASEGAIQKDIRKKKSSGKWNDYSRRPSRVVSYMGINRILPPSESKSHKGYSRQFTAQKVLTADQNALVKNALTRIFGHPYTDINLLSHNIYRLFDTKRGDIEYSGFNMGAGENAVLGLLVEILSAGKGALIVIDEIELGLHALAQKNLIAILKEWCKEYHCQIVCSTHSDIILDAIPPEGRMFISGHSNATDIIPMVSSEFAFQKLSGETGLELNVFVEDEVGKAFLENVLPQSLRERIHIVPIGSDQAILKHISVHYREKDYAFISFMDGDKRRQTEQQIRQISNHLEGRIDHSKEDFNILMKKRLNYLPGSTWPESVLVGEALKSDSLGYFADIWDDPNEEDIRAELEIALSAGKHKEFYSLSKSVSLSLQEVRTNVIKFYKINHKEEIREMIETVENILHTI